MSAPVLARVAWETRRRRGVVALAVAAAAAFVGAYFLPWWQFQLFAPQYPKGLKLVIHLTGVLGDTAEIDTINHYIGMHSLAQSATLERAASRYLIGGTAFAVVAAMLLAGRRVGWLALVIGLGLPVGFLVDTTYWMYVSGHDLDPRAPIHLKAFMPAVIGEGKVGQFHTYAVPESGFYLVIAALVLLAVATWQRAKVCKVCPERATCSLVCEHRLLGAPK